MITHANPSNCATMLSTKLLVLAALICSPALSWAEAGKAIFVLGDVKILSKDGSEHALIKGGLVEEGDTIVTTGKGQVQLKMHDGGLIAVRPDSKFRIDEFVHENNVEKDKDVFSLMKGSFRSVTGAIGHNNKEAYKVKTPVATIGIRGTDYTARLCEGDCGGSTDGLYVGVMSGGVYLMNDVAILDVSPGEYGYVESVYAAPVYLDQVPGDLLFAQGTAPAQKAIDIATADAAIPLMAAGSEPLNVAVLDTSVVNSNDPMVYAFAQNKTSSLADTVSDATMVSDGSIASNGISWGHWASGTATVDGTTIDTTDMAWIKGQDVDQTALASKSGSVEYFLSADTQSTTTTTGVQSSSYFMANFDAKTIDMSLQIGKVGASSQDWAASVNGAAIDTTTGTFGGAFDSVTAPAPLVATTDGNFAGAFVGNANAAIVAYSIGGTTIASTPVDYRFDGTAVFQSTP